MHVWAKGTWCHRVGRGHNSSVPLGGMARPPVHRASASLPGKTHSAFKRPQGTAGSGAGSSQDSRKPKKVGRHCLPYWEGCRWFSGQQEMLLDVGSWVGVQLPVPALHVTRAGYTRRGSLRGYVGWGWMGWTVAVFAQRLCKGPSEQCQPWKLWKTQLDALERPCWYPAWMVCVFFPAFPLASRPRSPAARWQSCACQQAPLFWALVQPLTPMPTLCRVSFSLSSSHGCRQGEAKHLHALTNSVYHLLRFYFLQIPSFGPRLKDSASFFLHKRTAAGMDGLPATAAETSLLPPSCAVLSIITSIIASIIAAHHGAVTPEGTPLSAVGYRHIQLTLNSILTFGDVHIHSSKTSFLNSNLLSVLHTVSRMGFMLKWETNSL